MTEAPEKIWASDISAGVYYSRNWFNSTEYTRSDIADTLRNERNAHRSDSWALGVIRARLTYEADTLRAEVARLRAALEPFADVSDFLASETEGLSDDDVFNLKLAGARFLVMTYTAKQFHDARAALAHGEAD
jgi:hypothetical protein